MSDDRPRCPVTGKVCYTQAAAKKARQGLQRLSVRPVSKYRCPSAHLHPEGAGIWHVGHLPTNNGKRARRPIIGPIGG